MEIWIWRYQKKYDHVIGGFEEEEEEEEEEEKEEEENYKEKEEKDENEEVDMLKARSEWIQSDTLIKNKYGGLSNIGWQWWW